MNHFKHKGSKLERLRGVFFQVGLLIAGGLTLLAFEWQTENQFIFPEDDPVIDIGIIDDLPPITFQDTPERPKVKIIQPKVIIDKIKIVPDDIKKTHPNDPVELEPLPDFVPDEYEPMSVIKEPEFFTIVEHMPEFIGGERARLQYLKDNTHYPSVDKFAGIEGTVYLQFLVNKKGEIKKVKVLRGVSETIDREAIRVVKNMPQWKPGKQRGKAVNVSYNFSLKFNLN